MSQLYRATSAPEEEEEEEEEDTCRKPASHSHAQALPGIVGLIWYKFSKISALVPRTFKNECPSILTIYSLYGALTFENGLFINIKIRKSFPGRSRPWQNPL
jgi:hypothetical protein